MWMDIKESDAIPFYNGRIVMKVIAMSAGLLDNTCGSDSEDVTAVREEEWKRRNFKACKGSTSIRYEKDEKEQVFSIDNDSDDDRSQDKVKSAVSPTRIGDTMIDSVIKTKHTLRPLASTTVQAAKSIGSFLR